MVDTLCSKQTSSVTHYTEHHNERNKKVGNSTKIVSTNTECNPGLLNSSSIPYTSRFGTQPNANPTPPGIRGSSVIRHYKIKKVSPSFIHYRHEFPWSSRGYIKKQCNLGEKWKGQFKPIWSHLEKSFSFTLLTKICILRPTITAKGTKNESSHRIIKGISILDIFFFPSHFS